MELVSLKHLEESLPFPMFKRVHKSFIVNIRYTNSLHTGYVMMNDQKIPVGQTYRDEVADWFNKNTIV
jgi:DNA-binding LytR/AlgR family response regulator